MARDGRVHRQQEGGAASGRAGVGRGLRLQQLQCQPAGPLPQLPEHPAVSLNQRQWLLYVVIVLYDRQRSDLCNYITDTEISLKYEEKKEVKSNVFARSPQNTVNVPLCGERRWLSGGL